jgi:hypothetical protein
MERTASFWPTISIAFLHKLWSHHSNTGYVFLGTLERHGGRWLEHAVNLAEDFDFESFFARYSRRRYDLYFCPNRFRRPRRQKQYASATPFAWSDIDGGDTSKCKPSPNLIFETSPGRYQALWLWDVQESTDRAEQYSQILANIANGDPNGWSITKYLRIPETYNHKPDYNRPLVRMVHHDWKPQRKRPPAPTQLAQRLEPRIRAVASSDQPSMDFETTFRKFRAHLHHRVRCLIRDSRPRETDRSKCVFEIVADLYRIGATFDEITVILRKNVYFKSKYGTSAVGLERETQRILTKLESKA